MRLPLKLLPCIVILVVIIIGLSAYENYRPNALHIQQFSENALKSTSYFAAENIALSLFKCQL